MRIAIPHFPGASGADDLVHAFSLLGCTDVRKLNFDDENLGNPDLVVIPSGFSFGDYLRPGALARVTPVAAGIRSFANKGGKVFGIGNGFQILCELNLLPGAFLPNADLDFKNQEVHVKVQNVENCFLEGIEEGTSLKLPVAHYSGCYFCDPRVLREIEDEGKVFLRYVDEFGEMDEKFGFNGSIRAIAGLISRHGNVVGVMPRVDRAVDELFGSTNGRTLLEALLS